MRVNRENDKKSQNWQKISYKKSQKKHEKNSFLKNVWFSIFKGSRFKRSVNLYLKTVKMSIGKLILFWDHFKKHEKMIKKFLKNYFKKVTKVYKNKNTQIICPLKLHFIKVSITIKIR